jgi:hypothetical protein
MRNKNSLVIFGFVLVMMTGFLNIQAYGASTTFTGTNSALWNDAGNWSLAAVPTSSDDVFIPVNKTAQIDVAVTIANLTVVGTLEPDDNPSRTIVLTDALTVESGGQVNYNNASGNGVGRLSWTLTGAGSTNEIDNQNATGTIANDAATLQFYDFDLTSGNISTNATLHHGHMTIYGDMTVNADFNISSTTNHSTIYFGDDGTTNTKTILNLSNIYFNAVVIAASADVVCATDLYFRGDLEVKSGGTFAISSPLVTFNTNDGITITPTGTLTFATGGSVAIDVNTTLAASLTGFDADITLATAKTLTVNSGLSIAGTGSITTNAASGIVIEHTSGLGGVFAFTGTSVWNATTNYTINDGILGFSTTTPAIATIGDLTLGDATGGSAVTGTESFSMSGDLVVTNGTAANSFETTSGTVTMTGSSNTITVNTSGGESIDLNGLHIAATGGISVGDTDDITINDWIGAQASGSITFLGWNSSATNTVALTFDGTSANLWEADGDGTGIIIQDNHGVSVTGSLTLDNTWVIPTHANDGTFTVGAAGTLDLAGYTLTLAGGGTKMDFQTTSGATLKTALAGGFDSAILAGASAFCEIDIKATTTLEYNLGATSLGLVTLGGTGATRTDETNDFNVVINGAAIATAAASTTITGDFTLTTGSMTLTAGDIDFGSSGDVTITNSLTDATKLQFYTMNFTTSNTITTSGDFYVAGTGGTGTALNIEQGAALEATTNQSHIYFNGASGDILVKTASGVCNLYDVTIATGAATTLNVANAAAQTVHIKGDLTLAGTGTLIAGGNAAGESIVKIDGTAAQVITVASGAGLTLDIVRINNTVGVTTASDMQWSSKGGAVAIPGKFTQSSGTVTLQDDLGTAPVIGVTGSATFFHVIAGAAADVVASTGSYAIVGDLDGSGTFNQTSGTVTFYGDPSVADATAITNDGKFVSVISVTGFAPLGFTVAAGCEAQLDVVCWDANTLDGVVNGRLELTATSNTFQTGGNVAIRSGGTLHLSGTNTNSLTDVCSALTFHTGGSLIMDGTATDITGAGGRTLDITNLTLSSTGAIVLEAADDFNIRGNLVQDGANMGASAASSSITLAGSSSAISGSNLVAVGDLYIAPTATGATASASISILGTGAGVLNVGLLGSFVSSDLITFSANVGSATGIINANTTAGGNLTFQDVTIAAANTTGLGVNSPFHVSGSFTHVANGLFYVGQSGSTTFNGANQFITIAADNEVSFYTVTFDGSTLWSGDFDVLVNKDLTVTSVGSFKMENTAGTKAGEIDFGGNTIATAVDIANASATFNIVNNNILEFNDVSIDLEGAGNNLVATTSYEITGNLIHTQGELNNQSDNVVTLSGTGSLQTAVLDDVIFEDLKVTGTTTYGGGAADDIHIGGDLTITSTGSLAAVNDGDVVNFIGGNAKTIANAGTLTVGDLTIADVASNAVTTATDMTILDDFTVGTGTDAGASFEATAGTLTFGDGTGYNSIIYNNAGSATSLKMNSVTIATGEAVTLSVAGSNDEYYINGDLTVTGTGNFIGGTASKIWMNGSSEQTISLGSHANAFNPYNLTLNNTGGAKLVSTNTSVGDNDFLVLNIFRLQNGDFDLNGDNVLSIDYDNTPATARLDETVGNTVVNNGPASSTGYVYATEAAAGAVFSNKNFAGLGMLFSTDVDPTSFTVKRYHIPRTIASSDQLKRYYSVTSGVTTGLGTKIVMKYDDSELGALTESDLVLLYSDDPSAGPWFIDTTAVVSTSLNRLTTDDDVVAGFTGGTEWWTAANVDILYSASITNGLADNPLASGTDDNAIIGLQFTTNGTIDLSTVRFNLGRALGTPNESASFSLYYSSDNDFSTSTDNVVLVTGYSANESQMSGGTTGDSYIEFDITAESSDYTSVLAGSPVNLFLAINTASGLTTSTLAITPQLTHSQVTVTEGIVAPFSITGTAYTFEPSIEIEPNENGISSGPLAANETDNAIFAFKAEVTSAVGGPSFSGFTLSFDIDPTSVFDNTAGTVKFYQSDDSDFGTTGDNNQITLTTETWDASAKTLLLGFASGGNAALTVAPKYYFVTVDVLGSVDDATSSITPTMTFSDITGVNAGVRGTDGDGNTLLSYTGRTYEFIKPTASISTGNNIAATNLGQGLTDQTIYAFTLTPDDGQNMTMTAVTFDVNISSQADTNNLTNWKMGADANGNGFLDGGEQIGVTINSVESIASNGLSFTGLTEAITSATKYLVTVKVGSAMTAGTTIGVNIQDESYVSVNAPTSINAGGPFPSTDVSHTVVTPTAATDLLITQMYDSTLTSGATLPFTVMAVDSAGYPANTTALETVTITKVSGTGVVTSGGGGSIASGTNYITITPVLTAATGSTNLLVNAVGTSLISSSFSSSITIVYPEPSTNDGYVTFTSTAHTSTSLRINQIFQATGATGSRVVVLRQGLAPAAPTDGVAYTASLDIGAAGDVGSGQTGAGSYVIYDGTANGVVTLDVTGLMPDTRYYFQVFEYVGSGATRNYASASAWVSDTQQNPVNATTSTGDFGTITDSTTAANIQTDIDISSSISATGDVDYFKFRMPSTKNNCVIRVSGLSSNCNLEVYDASSGVSSMTLLRNSEISSTGDEVIVINGLGTGPFLIKVFEDSSETSPATSYTLRVSTSDSEVYTQTQ